MNRREFVALTAAGAVAAIARPARAAAALTDAEVEARVAEILPRLSLWQKVSIMSGRITDGFIEKARGYGYSATFNTPGLPEHGIPGVRFIDGPRGINFAGSTCFPVAMARGASWDVGLCERVGEAIGYEARAGGANYWGGLCQNVLRHPAGGRSQETFGEDTHHLGAMAVATLRGAQRHVMACAKHYCCNNNEDSRFYVNVRIDERTLREIYLPHFAACVGAGVASVMSAYNDVNGQLCGQNPHLLRDILKGDLGFKGFVVSDFSQGVEATVPAARAGLDIEMPGTVFYGRKLWAAVKAGLVPVADIDEAASRIIRTQLRFLHLEDEKLDRAKIAGPEHAALAREAARKGMVLLRNNGGLLPLDPRGIKKLAVLGPMAARPNIGDNGSSAVRPPYVITPLEGLRARLPGVELAYGDGRDAAALKRACAGADAVVVFAGLTWKDEGEGGSPFVPGDRENLGLHPDEIKLIRVAADENKKVVVVLMGGSAITLGGWGDLAPAILMAWYPGMEGGHAIAEVLCGDHNPSGRLPFMWPKDLSQCAPLSSHAPVLHYDAYHGYRLADRDGFDPEFPFGFGLSYTAFRHANLALRERTIGRDGTLGVSVDVTNTGAVAGEEVVQAYVGCKGTAVPRAKKELKAFAKVLLAPGETKTVALEIPARSLAYYDVAGKGWQVEAADYVVSAGPSARESDLLKAEFKIG